MAGGFARLRQRFGIAAPRVTVRTHLPWPLRSLAVIALTAIALALAAWFFDAGRLVAGFDRGAAEQELAGARRDLGAALEELERLRALANAADSKLAIERTAQQKLAQQVRSLEQDNARLREDLAVFESMLSSEAARAAPLSILGFKVEPEVIPGEYRYRLLLLAPGARRGREFHGRLELAVSLSEAGRSAIITVPEPAQAQSPAFQLAFKHFQRVEGTFRVNPRARVEKVQARIYDSGAGTPRATQSVAPG